MYYWNIHASIAFPIMLCAGIGLSLLLEEYQSCIANSSSH